MSERDMDRAGESPSDTEALVGDTAASEPLTERERVAPAEVESREAAATTPDSAMRPRGAGDEGVERVADPDVSDPE